jgi:UPF0755 protein
LLYEWFRWSGRARQIKAGSYEIGAGTTPIRLLDKMVRGDETLAAVRFNEGWTFRQIRAELARAESLKPSTASLSDGEVMTALGAAGVSPEGRFHPDTYLYSKGSSDLAVLKRAYRAMERRLAEAWQERDPATPLQSAEEALTLASIVEKETGTAPIAAASPACSSTGFASACRCRPTRPSSSASAPPSTATCASATCSPTGRTTPTRAPACRRRRSPFRARRRCSPRCGPEPTKALYFVARGDGSSEFSETLADHNRAVNRFQRKSSP